MLIIAAGPGGADVEGLLMTDIGLDLQDILYTYTTAYGVKKK